jgi:hypothetical protein
MPVAPSGYRTKAFAYEEFMGLDVSRDRYALDTGQKQHLVRMEGGYCDPRGTIIRDHGVFKRGSENQPIEHIAFYGRDLACYVRRDGGGLSLCAENSGQLLVDPEVFPVSSVVSSTVFNGKVLFASADQPMRVFDGVKFTNNTSELDPRAAYVTAVQRRLAIAGIPGRPTEIWLSRVDNENVMPEDDKNNKEVTRAAFIDIRNIIATADEVKGLGVFETNRLAIFTNDQVVIYAIDPSYERWGLDDKANVRIGTISHNTIRQAGTDLIFCSRVGVHSLKRSDANGTTIYSVPMSTKVEDMYRRFVNGVERPEQINAVFDQDNQQYHVFFPQAGGVISYRLTLTLNPFEDGEHKWSTSAFLNARCGAQLGGVTLFGTHGGVYQIAQKYQYSDPSIHKKLGIIQPDFVAETPVLWHGTLTENKHTASLVLQATGQGEIIIEAFDEKNRSLWAKTVALDEEGVDGNFSAVALPEQYEIPFEHQYRGVWLRFTGKSKGIIKIIGFAVIVRKEQ